MKLFGHRNTIRLQKYDYSDAGWYFVTICTENRECLFGEISVGATRGSPFSKSRGSPFQMKLNDIGKIIKNIWKSLPNHHPVKLDESMIMPNHVHGIIIMRNANHSVGAIFKSPVVSSNVSGEINFAPTINISLSNIIKWYKSKSTINIRTIMNKTFCWQKSFYDVIIRNEISLYFIRQYIFDNPKNWNDDRNNICLFDYLFI